MTSPISISSSKSPIRRGILNNAIEYELRDVRGDGNCFYRAVYRIMQDADGDVKERLALADVHSEDAGVGTLRAFIASAVDGHRANPDSHQQIDNLCDLVQAAKPKDRKELIDNLHDNYPFVTAATCKKQGDARYKAVADMIRSTKKRMYASGLENEVVRKALMDANVALLTISSNGSIRSSTEKKWQADLNKLLERTTASQIAVILNRNNEHYQYLRFREPGSERYRSLIDRSKMSLLMVRSSHPTPAPLLPATVLKPKPPPKLKALKAPRKKKGPSGGVCAMLETPEACATKSFCMWTETGCKRGPTAKEKAMAQRSKAVAPAVANKRQATPDNFIDLT